MEQINQSFGFQINFTTRNMRRYSNEMLKQAGLDITIDHWGILKILDENSGQLNASQISSIMLKDKPTVTRIIDVMARKGLVERIPDTKDRRVIMIRLTNAGKKRTDQAQKVIAEIRSHLGRFLNDKDLKDLRLILEKINKAVTPEV